MKATDLVLTQHREVEQLFEQLAGAHEGDQKAVREELAQNLVAHAVIEQEYLYPAMKEVLREEIDRSYVEHGIMAYALSQLLSTRPTDESFHARVSVLKEITEMHMRQEENETLKKAESALGHERLLRMGEEMEARFEQIRAKGYKSFLRQALAEAAPQMRGRPMAKKTAAKPSVGAKRTTQRRAPARQAQEARQTSQRGAAQNGRKRAAGQRGAAGQKSAAGQKARGARASSR